MFRSYLVGGYIVKGVKGGVVVFTLLVPSGLALVSSRPINFEVESEFSCLEPVNDILPCLWYLENGGVPSERSERPSP